MLKLTILTSLLFSSVAIAAFPPTGWKVGTCNEVKSQLTSELSKYERGFHNTIPDYFKESEERLELIKNRIGTVSSSLESNYTKLQNELSNSLSSLTKSCLNQPYVFKGKNGDFSMLRMECQLKGNLLLEVSYLAIKKGDRAQQLYTDGKEHLVARVCIESNNYFNRSSGRMTWFKTNLTYCLNYDLVENSYFSYRNKKKLGPSINLEDTNLSFGYSFTHFDPSYRLTPGGVTSSEYVEVNGLQESSDLVARLLTPTACGNPGKPVYHEEQYLYLVPGKSERSCPWYDLLCWLK